MKQDSRLCFGLFSNKLFSVSDIIQAVLVGHIDWVRLIKLRNRNITFRISFPVSMHTIGKIHFIMIPWGNDFCGWYVLLDHLHVWNRHIIHKNPCLSYISWTITSTRSLQHYMNDCLLFSFLVNILSSKKFCLTISGSTLNRTLIIAKNRNKKSVKLSVGCTHL